MSEQLDLLAGSAQKPRRRERDAYFTPLHCIAALKEVEGEAIHGEELVDPCCGDGRMAEVFAPRFRYLTLNDLEPKVDPQRLEAMRKAAAGAVILKRCDATIPEPGLWVGCDWVVTNPPWNVASAIALHAIEYARQGVALLLRLSFLEATQERQWLQRYPPRSIIVLPRTCFDGSGRTDSVCPAWLLWGPAVSRPGVHIFGKADAAQLALTLAK